MADRDLLPFISEALNDIYSKIDVISNQLKQFESNLTEFLREFNQQIGEVVQKIGKIHDIIQEVEVAKEYKSTNKLFQSTLEQINEGTWYIDFLLALKRILNVVKDIEI